MGPIQDEVYYFQNVTFQVGNTLFRIPKSAFNVPGTIFEAMFALPPTPDAEGSTDENPIVLHVDENHFRRFLRVILRLRGQEVADEDWLGALDLATVWSFDDVRQEAIQALDGWAKSQSLKQVVIIAKKYNIGSWLQIAYTQLTLRELPFDELTYPPAVDWETIARLLYVQHRGTLRAQPNAGPYGVLCVQCRTGKLCCGYIAPSVQEMFQGEFESMKETCSEIPALPLPVAQKKK